MGAGGNVVEVKTVINPEWIRAGLEPQYFQSRGLLDYQIPATRTLLLSLAEHGAAIDGSDTGVGKTFAAGAVIRNLNLPTLVVCPQIVIPGWKRMSEKLGVNFSIENYEMLRTGNTPFGWWDNPRPKQLRREFRCTACQCVVENNQPSIPCPYHERGIHCVESRTLPHRHGHFNWAPQIQLLVFDEVHRCGAPKSLQSDMLIAAKRQRILTVGLSATVAQNPMQMRAIGYWLGLHKLTDFYPWAMSHGCSKMPFGGFSFSVGTERRIEIMTKLNRDIFPSRGCRVRFSDLGDAFPKCQITAELYDLEGAAGRIDALYGEMESAIAELQTMREMDKAPEHPLTMLLRLRQEIELLKVPVFCELTADALAQGLHVALFVNFRQSVEELCRRLKTECRIDGSQVGVSGAARRNANVDDFLNDREPVIVCSAAAGHLGIDLHDIHGNFPRLGLVSLGFSAAGFKQLCGRLRRQGGKSVALYRILLAANTREEKVHSAMMAKLTNLDLLHDGDLQAALPIRLTDFASDAMLRKEHQYA